jgi:hypothetical protein
MARHTPTWLFIGAQISACIWMAHVVHEMLVG